MPLPFKTHFLCLAITDPTISLCAQPQEAGASTGEERQGFPANEACSAKSHSTGIGE